MQLCGTFRATEISCLNCDNFLLWGVNYGNCMLQNEDFPCEHKCDNFEPFSGTEESRYI